jgi:hypothetical protein
VHGDTVREPVYVGADADPGSRCHRMIISYGRPSRREGRT